jgi:hypothetical protein
MAQEKARGVLGRKKKKKVEVFVLFPISDYYLMCLASTYFLVTRFESAYILQALFYSISCPSILL